MKDFKLEKDKTSFWFRLKDDSIQDASMTEVLLYRILEELEKLNSDKSRERL